MTAMTPTTTGAATAPATATAAAVRFLRVTRRLTAMCVMENVEYRGAFLVYMLNNVAGPAIYLLVWLTVSDQGVRLPYSRSAFVNYYVLMCIVSMLTSSWLAAYLAERIRLGTLSPWLLRPVPVVADYLGNNLGEKVVKLPLLLPLVGLLALAFRDSLRLPSTSDTWLLFGVSVALAAAVTFLSDLVLGSLAFWLEDVQGVLRVRDMVYSFLTGRFVPLALFPPEAQGALEAQPFRYMLSFPLEIATGELAPDALTRGFAWQVFYLLGLWLVYRVQWRLGLPRYSASGA